MYLALAELPGIVAQAVRCSCHHCRMLYWVTWNLCRQDNVELSQDARWTTVKLVAPYMARRKWLTRGWRTFAQHPIFPIFVRGIRKKKPPFRPAGIQVLKEHELRRYEHFKFAYPPYQYQDKYMVKGPRTQWQPPT